MKFNRIRFFLLALVSLLPLPLAANAQSATTSPSTKSSSVSVGNLQAASASVSSVVQPDDPQARQLLKTFLGRYVRPDGSDWNITLNLSVSESGNSPISHTVQMIGSKGIRRAFVRNGRAVTSTLANGTGVVDRDGVQENVPVWIAQSSKVSEFPFPALIARLQDPKTLISFPPSDATATGLIHIRLSTLCYDLKGQRRPIAERVFEVDLFFDSRTSLLTKERHWIFSPSSMTNATQVDTAYSDYRIVGNLQLAFHITKSLGGHVLEDTNLVSADLNANNGPIGMEASIAK